VRKVAVVGCLTVLAVLVSVLVIFGIWFWLLLSGSPLAVPGRNSQTWPSPMRVVLVPTDRGSISGSL
jgi:hypothetical protein